MAAQDTQDSGAHLARWFSQMDGVSPEALARVRARVQGKLDAGTCKNVMPMASQDLIADYELRACVEQALLEEWDSLSSEERLRLCRHPSARKVGDEVRLPNRAGGKVVSQELTKRMSVLMTLAPANGSPFSWEFYV